MTSPREESAEQIVEQIASAVNSGAHPPTVRDEFEREHNALQQRAMDEAIKPMLRALATAKYEDARNERAVEEAREMLRAIDDRALD